MARGENQKVKILFVAKYLWDYSDAEHPIRVGDKDSDGDCLVKFLAENGVDADRRSVYRDIQALRDIYGMDIEGGQGGRYRLKSRGFDFDDLCLLTECVNSARFLPEKKAKELVETVKSFASQYQAEALDKVYLCDGRRPTTQKTLRNIRNIRKAMARKVEGQPHKPQKITFKYTTHEIANSIMEHGIRSTHRKRNYKVSPYKLILKDGFYYLLGYDHQKERILTYRVDRMADVRLSAEPSEVNKYFRGFDTKDFANRRFSMFSGETKRVEILFTNDLLDTAIDRFGTTGNVNYLRKQEDKRHFHVFADVAVSNQFYSWLCGFRKKAKLLAPPETVEGFKEFLADIQKRYETEE